MVIKIKPTILLGEFSCSQNLDVFITKRAIIKFRLTFLIIHYTKTAKEKGGYPKSIDKRKLQRLDLRLVHLQAILEIEQMRNGTGIFSE
ncbi:MAG: hypothetical protein WAV32_00265 [Halobacteriota archaeon]